MAESTFSAVPASTSATSAMLQLLAIQEWIPEQESILDHSTMGPPSSVEGPSPAAAPVVAAAPSSLWRVTPPSLTGVEDFDCWMDSIRLIASVNGWDEHLKSRRDDDEGEPSIDAALNLLLYTTISGKFAQDLKAKGWTRKSPPAQTLSMIASLLTEEKDETEEPPVKQAIKRLDPLKFPSLFAFVRRMGVLHSRYEGNRYALWDVVLPTIKDTYPPWYDKWERVRRRHGFVEWKEFELFLLQQAVHERMGRDVTEEGCS